MTTKIDELNTRYLIPGVELGAAAAADPEGAEEDYGDAPYSHLAPLGEMPSPTGWQDLLGLNRVSFEPGRIDPPPRPASLRQWPTATTIGGSLRLPVNITRDDPGGPAVSPKVDRMIAMLARYERATRYIRARASEGGGQ
jgi:hypothetical protein